MAPIVRWILIVVLLAAGIYMAIFHADPFPASHEAIGLGKLHIAHTVFGVVLFAAAGYVWYSARGKAPAAPAE